MKSIAFLGLITIAALPVIAQRTFIVEGTVVNSATGAGVSGASIQLVLTEGALNILMRGDITNEAGTFRISDLKPGDYTARANKKGYSGMRPVLFHIDADGTSIRPRFELIPPSTLRGRIVDVDGNPVKATVELGPGLRNSVRTDDEGNFTFEELAPGSYTLLGRPEPSELVFKQDGLPSEAVPTYYPSALERSQAELIAVRGGLDLSGYEIRLQSGPTYRVSGIVLDPAGQPAPGAVVQLLDQVSDGLVGPLFSIRSSPLADTSNPTRSTITGEDGTFEFRSVRPGDWMARVESDSIRDNIQQRDVIGFGSMTIHLGHRDLDGIQIRLGTPFDLSGTVEGGNDSPGAARAVVALNGESGYFGGNASPNAKGVLQFEGVIPGRYLISAEGTGDYYPSILLGSSDVTGQTVELGASSPPMRVVLKPGGTIRWTLDPSNNWTVVVVPQNLTGVGYSFQAHPGFASNPELRGIAPGEYYAIALDQFNPRTMADTPHLRELIPSATSVRVREGAVSSLELKVIHFPN